MSNMDTLSQAQILAYLRNNKALFEERFGVTQIALFGSFARNEAHGASDVDLLIMTKTHSFRNRFYLKEYLEKQFNRKVDICYFGDVRLFIKKRIEKDLIYA